MTLIDYSARSYEITDQHYRLWRGKRPRLNTTKLKPWQRIDIPCEVCGDIAAVLITGERTHYITAFGGRPGYSIIRLETTAMYELFDRPPIPTCKLHQEPVENEALGKYQSLSVYPIKATWKQWIKGWIR